MQQNTRTDNSVVINIWLGCKRSRSYQKPARFPASLAGDLKGNKACSVSRQSCHLDCLHIMNPEVSRDCSSRKALPQRRLAGHCLKNFPVLEVPAPKTARLLLEMTVSKWPGRIRRTRAEPRTLVLSFQLPTEIEQMILFLNNFTPSVECFFSERSEFFRRIYCKREIPMDSSKVKFNTS